MYKKDDDSSQYVNVTVFVQKSFLTFVGEVFFSFDDKRYKRKMNFKFSPRITLLKRVTIFDTFPILFCNYTLCNLRMLFQKQYVSSKLSVRQEKRINKLPVVSRASIKNALL